MREQWHRCDDSMSVRQQSAVVRLFQQSAVRVSPSLAQIPNPRLTPGQIPPPGAPSRVIGATGADSATANPEFQAAHSYSIAIQTASTKASKERNRI